jgi:hypothetical protein
MRPILIIGSLAAGFILSQLAWAQAAGPASVISGYASNWLYGFPFVPLVTTPSVAIETGMPTQVGASNATAGNVAGASNSTLSLLPAGNEPGPKPPAAEQSANPQEQNAGAAAPAHRGLELGVASFESSKGIARLVAARPQGPPARTFTDQDIQRLNEKTGQVEYGGKTEKME